MLLNSIASWGFGLMSYILAATASFVILARHTPTYAASIQRQLSETLGDDQVAIHRIVAHHKDCRESSSALGWRLWDRFLSLQGAANHTTQRIASQVRVFVSNMRTLWPSFPQRLQYPLIKEYTLNQIRDPTIFYGVFLNQGILESLGN